MKDKLNEIQTKVNRFKRLKEDYLSLADEAEESGLDDQAIAFLSTAAMWEKRLHKEVVTLVNLQNEIRLSQ